MAIEAPSNATKLVVVAIILALAARAEKIAALLQGWDSAFFWVVIVLFLAASRVGTKIVLRIAAEGGELPANDELFNLPELSSQDR